MRKGGGIDQNYPKTLAWEKKLKTILEAASINLFNGWRDLNQQTKIPYYFITKGDTFDIYNTK